MRFIAALVFALIASFAAAPIAAAKAKLEIADIELSKSASVDKQRDRRIRTAVRRMASQAAKHLDFGKQGKVEVSLLVKELTVTQEGDVLRITCTIVGKLKGGGSAKSRISFGGHPAKKKQLQRQVLASVTDGVMTRLSMLARTREKEREKATS